MNATLHQATGAATHAVGDLKGRTSKAVEHARKGILDYVTSAAQILTAFRALELPATDTMLARVGLQRRTSFMRPALWMTAGIIVGGGSVFAFYSPAGQKLRARMTEWLKESASEAKRVASTIEKKAASASDGAGVPIATATRVATEVASKSTEPLKHGTH